MYQVLARRWRPQSFEELVGQAHVARALQNAIEADRLAHAYIFSGVRGTGKTTAARLLAKCLNCERGPARTPCNECTSCHEIAEGRSIDVLEMDAASRTGVQDIRELQEVVSYAPVRDRYKVLIIDEVHMLSRQAFNALLKTLEEPPRRVVFVLATTELQKVLPTILSRCQVFEFPRVPSRLVAAHLRKVCEREGIDASEATLDRIARSGEGSVRDALSVLERVLAFCGTSVTDEEALQALGAVRGEVLIRLAEGLGTRDAAVMLTVLDELVREGHDLVHFWNELVSVLRDLLVSRHLPGHADAFSRPGEEMKALERSVTGLSDDDLVRAFQIVADLEPGLRASSQPRFLFEATMIRLASLGHVRPVEEILASLESGGPPPGGGGNLRRFPERKTPDPRKRPDPQRPPRRSDSTPAEPVDAGGPGLPGFFPAFVSAVHAARPMLGAVLDHARKADLRGDTLVIDVGGAGSALRNHLEGALEVLRECAREAAGRPVEIRLGSASPAGPEAVEGPEPPRTSPPRGPDLSGPRSAGRRNAEDPEPAEGAGANGEPSGPRPAGPSGPEPVGPSGLLESAKQEPGISKLLFEFGARVVDIRPLEAPRDLVAGETESGPMEESP